MAGVGKVVLSNADLRENFRVAAQMIAAENYGGDIKKVNLNDLVQGYILSMIDAKVNQSQLQFPITNTDLNTVGAPNIPMMRIVNQVDAFVAGKLGYYLLLYAFTGGNQVNPNYGNGFRMTPMTFPNIYEDNNGAANIDPGCIIFWHANISIEVNGIKLYKAWETLQHLYCPPVQATPTLAAANVASFGGGGNPFAITSGQLPFWQPNQYSNYDGGQDAFYPLEPLPVFNGAKQNIVLLNLPANIPTTIAPFNIPNYGTTFILKICCHFRGVLGQNCGLR